MSAIKIIGIVVVVIVVVVVAAFIWALRDLEGPGR